MQVKIAVESEDDPGTVEVTAEILRKRLAERVEDEETWREVRGVPHTGVSRPGAGRTMSGGALEIILIFAVEMLVAETVRTTAEHVVRAIVAHFRAHPDGSQRVQITGDGTRDGDDGTGDGENDASGDGGNEGDGSGADDLRIVLTPGMTAEELATQEELLRAWIARHRGE